MISGIFDALVITKVTTNNAAQSTASEILLAAADSYSQSW